MFRKKRNSLEFMIQICIEKDGERYYAYCPALKGVHIDGETKEKAIENVKVATVLYIKSLIKHGDPIPIQIIVHSPETKKSPSVCHFPVTEQIQVPV